MLTPQIGKVAADTRARHLIVTDVPVAVESIRELVEKLDNPVKQVVMDTMVVDATLDDAAQTGVDWVLKAVQRKNARQAALGDNGRAIGSLQDMAATAAMPFSSSPAGALSYSLLAGGIDWKGAIQAEVATKTANLISNPILVTVENKEAKISISQEIPYTELTQSNMGGSQTNTRFKDIGTVLTITPRVTHDNHIIMTVEAKESAQNGQSSTGVPIEQKREMTSTVRMKTGQTVYIGGLRKRQKATSIRKIPLVGDIPLINIAFRTNTHDDTYNELLVFLTCNVLGEEQPDLTPYEQKKLDKAENSEHKADGQRMLFHNMVHPEEDRDPVWKWRRSE
jgi:type II secretory pathway component GspD/PulD (secretin)